MYRRGALAHSMLSSAPTRAEQRRDRRAEGKRGSLSQDEVRALLKRYDASDSRWQQYRELWEEAYELFLPQRNQLSSYAEGQKKTHRVLDGTPGKALKRYASRVQQNVAPPNRRFATLKAGIDTPKEKRDERNKRLAEQTEVLFEELTHSNLASELYEAILESGVSMGALMIHRGESASQPFRFEAVSAHETRIDEGPDGSVENVYRCRTLKVEHVARKWPGFQFSQQTLMEYSSKQPGEKDQCEVEIVEMTVLDPRRQVYDYFVIERKALHCGFQDALAESPWIIFRTNVIPGEIYGRGPALDALPDARTLQRVRELILRNAAIQIVGMYTAKDDDVVNVWNVQFFPGAIIPVAEHDQLRRMEAGGDIGIGEIIQNDLRAAIMDHMLAKEMPIEQGGVRSATEHLLRQQEFMRDAGPAYGRMLGELVLKIVRKSVRYLADWGRLDDVTVDGRDVDVAFEGPITRAQDEEELLRVSTAYEVAAPLGPEAIAAAVEPDVMAKLVFEKAGVWPEAIRSDGDRRKLLEQAAEAAVASAQAQAAPGMAGAPGAIEAAPSMQPLAGLPPAMG